MLDAEIIDTRMREQYIHFISQLNEIDYTGQRPFVSVEDALDAHFLVCDHFYKRGEGIGGFGPRDLHLESAIARQIASAGGAFVLADDDVFGIAATLMFGMVCNHPFHDANKRTAFLATLFLLYDNNYIPRISGDEIEDLTVEIAEGKLCGKGIDIDDLRERLRRMFRPMDKRNYTITFREMQTKLQGYGCSLENPNGNFIDVFKDGQRVAQVGFPGMSKQVTRNAVSTIRKATGLTAENGYDAQVFFCGEDPLSELIGEYQDQLYRLAYR